MIFGMGNTKSETLGVQRREAKTMLFRLAAVPSKRSVSIIYF